MKNHPSRTILRPFMIVGLFSLTSLLNSQPLVLDLEQAVKLALENNLDIQSSALDLQMKERVKNTVFNRFYPSINASATLSRSHVEPVVPFGTPPSAVNLSTSLQIQLPLNPALFPGIEQTKLDYQEGILSYQGAKARLEVEIRKAFNTLLALERDLELAENQLETARQRYLQTRENYQAGLTPELNLLSAQVSYERLKPSLQDKENSYAQAKMNFLSQLGKKADQNLVLEGKLEIPEGIDLPPLEELLQNIPQRQDLLSLSAQQKSLENLLTVQKLALLPSLILMASWDPSLNDPFGKPWFEDVEDNWPQRGGLFGLTLSWALDPYIPGSSQQVELQDLRDQRKKLDLAFQNLLNMASMEIRILESGIRKSLANREVLILSRDLARRAYELSDEAYRLGGQSLLEVQDAGVQLEGAQLQLIFEELAILNSLADLEWALGLSSGELLKSFEKGADQ